VTNLVFRLSYKGPSYQRSFSTQAGIRGLPFEKRDLYIQRSPLYHVDKLQVPLLVHVATNDEDVNVLEVEHLIQALKAAGKTSLFEYKIYQNAPGGHSFNRNDNKLARESRLEAYRFLARYLNPPNPPK
jgi:dipeptidyl aminopeptidase/acylaminoacyl peptidase